MADDADVSQPETIDIGGAEGQIAFIEGTDEDYMGFIAMAVANDYVYVFAAVASPASSWEDYELIFDAMLDSVELFEPAGTSAGEGRDDVPIPPGATVALNMPEMVMYQVDGSVADAVQFIQDNWPDYGWLADTDSFLHQPSEGLLIYTKGGEIGMIAVTEGEGDDVGKTDVIALFTPDD
jgi:hypothetical protein